MRVRFEATEIVRLDVPDATPPIQNYLYDIDRIVGAIADPKLTEKITADRFRLKMQSIGFLDLYKFQPVVTLRVWCNEENIVQLESIGCQLIGLEAFMDDFELSLDGTLQPVPQSFGPTQLHGKAHLSVELALPPPLWLTPKPLLQITGDRLLGEVLQRIKRQLLKQLLQDYQEWAKTQSLSS